MALPGILQRLNEHIANKIAHIVKVQITGDVTGSGTPDANGNISIAATGVRATTATKWDGAVKTVSTDEPSGGANGDIHIQYLQGA